MVEAEPNMSVDSPFTAVPLYYDIELMGYT